MTSTKTAAWARAQAEGLRFFWAHMHVGHSAQFVGTAWEDGGFTTNEAGNPVRDGRGNTVAKFTVEELDPECAQHVAQVEEWYG